MSDIEVRAEAVNRALDKLDFKKANSAIVAGERAGAKFLKPLVKAAAPIAPRARTYKGKTIRPGALKRSVAQFTAKRGDKPGAGVRLRGKVAPERSVVVPGSRGPRSTSKGANRGVMPSNPFVAEVADQHGNQALDIALNAIAAKLEL